MEIERGVKIEYGGDSEAGLSSGPRNMDQLPAYTEEELTEGLGEIYEEIANVFRQPAEPDRQDEFAGSGHA